MSMGGRFGKYGDAKRKDEQKYNEYRTKRGMNLGDAL